MSIQQEKFKEIADAIRMYTGETDLVKPSEFASKIDYVYNKGYYDGTDDAFEEYWNDGFNVGFKNGYEEGYNEFWDVYQQNGERGNYTNAFSGYGWTDEIFKPKYDIKPTSAVQMFHTSQITNLKKILDDCGVTLDFSNCSSLQYAFQLSQITHVGIIDARNCPNLNYFMPSSKMVDIEKLILKNDGSQTFTSAYTFSTCADLEHCIFEGVIGKNGLDLHWSTKLDTDSLESIINCLSTTTGLSVTLSKEAVNNAFETSEGLADGTTSAEWLALIATKSNWTISLV